MVKPTVHDIAKEAGVSLATVDRVINARPGVRARTVERVQDAIQRIGYVRDMSAANLARQRVYRFAFVLPGGASQFLETLREAIREAVKAQIADRTTIKVFSVPVLDPHAVVRTLGGIDPQRFDGLAIMAPETPQVRDAVARLEAAGMPVVALVSDLPNSGCDHFVGIDNMAAGRTAAVLMGRFLCNESGKVLVVANSMLARDSIDRRLGFDSVMAEQFPEKIVLPSVEAHDDPERIANIIKEAFVIHPDIAGVYSLTLGSQEVVEALRAAGHMTKLVVIVHELTPHSRKALEDREIDAVITQNVGHLVRSAIRVLRAKSDGLDIIESQEQIRIDIVLRENLP